MLLSLDSTCYGKATCVSFRQVPFWLCLQLRVSQAIKRKCRKAIAVYRSYLGTHPLSECESLGLVTSLLGKTQAFFIEGHGLSIRQVCGSSKVSPKRPTVFYERAGRPGHLRVCQSKFYACHGVFLCDLLLETVLPRDRIALLRLSGNLMVR